MKCDRFMNLFLALDNSEAMGLLMRRHLRTCRRCRREVEALSAAMDSLLDFPQRFPVPDGADRIMARIGGVEYTYNRRVPLYNWIGVGFLILLSMFLLPFSDSLVWLRGFFGGYIDIPYGIVMGLVLSVYVTVFAATNMDQLKARLRIRALEKS